ncbi:uncharacterized protein PGTG_05485 [Puccinia graminis f. sp. tritici CRL 75-36-700-3]|uniref:sn-1-specific diacylglycerol lipase n=1 Tax=Puccinia graminis f. sp. tritici (strain CRL 75-36-700-3 / race SCCL) TaxID=418459 RepID=E3K4H8_PUCGT|nr:uncharacterized protein PGTG_05485 [Puccinia graminis f. sp. tritici CRL 75-36-700-3]EFP79164.2 hypothetical protein PGTG_05485 [Puccinia graminis f. sp. tritici CRL 75-36-700-3]
MNDLDSPSTMPGYLPIGEPEPDQQVAEQSADVMGKPLSCGGTSMIVPAAHGALAIASFATRFGFTVAQKSVQFGLAIPQTIISNVLPSQLKPLSIAIQASLSFAEYSTLTALQLAQGISSTGLDLAAYSVTELDALIRSYQTLNPSLPSLDALKLIVVLLRQQWLKISPHASDLPPGYDNSTQPFQFFQVLRALSTWALIQQLTQHVEDRLFSSFLIPIQNSPSGDQKNEQFELGFEEDDDDGQEGHPEVVKQKFKRYIDLCLSSYGGLGHLLFSSESKPSPSPNGSDPKPSSSSSEPGKAPPSTYETWNLLLGKHDEDLIRRHGELFEDKDVPEALNEADKKIAEELKDLLPMELRKGQDEVKNKKEMNELMNQIGSLSVVTEAQEGGKESRPNLSGLDQEKTMREDGVFELASGDVLPASLDSSLPENSTAEEKENHPSSTAATSPDCQPPRYFILVDRVHRSVIVCLRGTFSLNDLSTDLTCDLQTFDPLLFWDDFPGSVVDTQNDSATEEEEDSTNEKKNQNFKVHQGFYEVSKKLIGFPNNSPPPSAQQQQPQPTKFMASLRNALEKLDSDENVPLNDGIQRQQKKNKRIEFVGHSLGAGVAVLLSLMLADPRTGLSTRRSGLPEGTSIRTYAICPPCTSSKGLTELSRKMIKTLIHSNDFIPRLSMDHVMNLKTMIIWIDYFENNPALLPSLVSTHKNSDGIWKNLLQVYTRLRIFQSQNNQNTQNQNQDDHQRLDASKQALLEDEVWLIEMKNLLESKIQKEHQMDVLLPTGMIYWMVKDDLFIVPKHKAQDIFNRIKFDISMVKDHLIHQVKHEFNKFCH